MRNAIKLLAIVLLMSSCATIRKNSSSKTNQQMYVDTSSSEHQYTIETVTEEKGSTTIIIQADSVQTSGTMSAEDTTTYQQTVETDGMSLWTTVKPKLKDGKVTGYNVNSKAVSRPKTVSGPTDKKTTEKETGINKQRRGMTDIKKETMTSSNKQAFRFNMAGAVLIVGIVLVILLFIYIKFRK